MSKEVIDLIEIIKIISTRLIESGDEINRVEEIINDIIISEGYTEANVFAISTGIFYSFKRKNKIYNDVIRIKKRGTNLKNIVLYTNISNEIINHKKSIKSSLEEIKSIEIKKHNIINIICGGLSTGFFTLLYGGNTIEFLISFICGLIIELITITFKRVDIFHFLNSLICSFISTTIAIILINLISKGNLDNIVIGSIMLILPGLTFTNSIKDIIMGNLVSGTSRLSETFFVAVAISIGVILSIVITSKVGIVI